MIKTAVIPKGGALQPTEGSPLQQTSQEKSETAKPK
jgi:hypothetical protein